MNEIKKYAEQWNASSKYFYDKKNYEWMTMKVSDYHTIVEIGCGTGYSTLGMVEQGHTVISIDKNRDCLSKAKELITEKGYANRVTFLEGDIATEAFQAKLLNNYKFDVVVCWNMGTYWNQSMMQFYFPYLLKYGLTIPQIKDNPESSYAELIIWDACKLASSKNVPVHIVDRGTRITNFLNDEYYKTLGSEFSFSEIIYDNLECDSLSNEGRTLLTNGIVNDSAKVKIILVSVLIK